jgi:putative hydrolase of the HAD superfamily
VSNAQACFTLPELEKIGLIPFFDGIVISSDVGVKKPSSQIFALALERFGLRADECVYVGNDMRDDIQGAYSAGLKTVYIQTEQSGKYDDSNMPSPTCTAENHARLVEILLSFPK